MEPETEIKKMVPNVQMDVVINHGELLGGFECLKFCLQSSYLQSQKFNFSSLICGRVNLCLFHLLLLLFCLVASEDTTVLLVTSGFYTLDKHVNPIVAKIRPSC